MPSRPSVVRETFGQADGSNADPFTGESCGFLLARLCPVQEWEEDRRGPIFGQCRFEKFSEKF